MSLDCPVRTIMALVAFAASAGVPPPELLRSVDLAPEILANPDAHVPYVQEMRLWDEAVRRTRDDDFGLHFAEWAARSAEEHFDVLTFAVLYSPTLGASYRLGGRYVRLIHDGVSLALEEDGDAARLVHRHLHGVIGRRHPVEAMLTLALLVGRRALGVDFAPRAVCFEHGAPASTAEHARIYRAPVRYGAPRSELVLDRALLDRPLVHAEERLLPILDRQLGGLLSALPGTGRTRDLVRRHMQDDLPEREPVVAEIAAKLRMSARSLQRRLHGEGTSFAAVLSDLRRDLAVRYLQDPRISVGEVAFLLGFLDVTAFHRAFKRWTGKTPSSYRRTPGA